MSMKKETIEFIKRLLEDEIKREIEQQSPNPKEIEYIEDLVSAANDFINKYGEFFDNFYLKSLLVELYDN